MLEEIERKEREKQAKRRENRKLRHIQNSASGKHALSISTENMALGILVPDNVTLAQIETLRDIKSEAERRNMLESLSVKELKQLSKAIPVKISAKAVKAQIIDEILKSVIQK